MKLQRIYKFIVVLVAILICKGLTAQNKRLTVVPKPVVFDVNHVFNPQLPVLGNTLLYTPAFNSLPVTASLAPDFYTQHFGFFCKKELQFEKATAIPLRIRLGGLDYVNKLEGK